METNIFNDNIIPISGDIVGSGLFYIKGNPVNLQNLDERFRVQNSFVYLERYNGTTWDILGTWGGSFETDKIYLYNPNGITGTFYKADEYAYTNFFRTTSKRGGIDIGDQDITTYITGKSENDVFISYPGIAYSQSVVGDISVNMPAGTYSVSFTWNAPTCEFTSFTGYVETPSKGRMVISETSSGRVIWENMTKSEFVATGGSNSAEAIRDVNGEIISIKTTGYVNVAVNPPAYLYNGSSYTAVLTVSEGNNKGNGTFPYFVVNGLESISKIIASKDYVNEQVLTAGCYTKPAYIDNGNGTVTLSAGVICVYSTPDKKGIIYKVNTVPTIITLTSNTSNYIVGDYNNGSPIVRVTTNVNEINQSNIIPIYTILVKDGLNILDWDEGACGLPNKISERFVKTDRFRLQSGLDISVGVGGNILIASGIVWYGVTPLTLDASNSSVNQTRLFYHSGGSWTYSPITTYNSTKYDNGTNMVTLTPSRYAVNWIYRGVEHQNHIYVLLGTGDYKLDEAQNAKLPTAPFPIPEHCILVGKIISAYNTTTPIEVVSTFDRVFAGSSTITTLDVSNMSIYENNTAAKTGGLTNGTIYRTSIGQLMVVF